MTDFIKKVKGLGLTSVSAGAIGVGLFVMGFPLFSGIALGIFIKANWDIAYKYYDENLRDSIGI